MEKNNCNDNYCSNHDRLLRLILQQIYFLTAGQIIIPSFERQGSPLILIEYLTLLDWILNHFFKQEKP